MSDSENADLPSDAAIARTLHDVVIAIHKTGNTDNLTVKRVRTRTEEELGLSAGFLKADQKWKQKSHDLIHEAVEKYCGDEPAPETKPSKAPKLEPTPAAKKRTPATDSPRGVKRKATAPAKKAQKRRRAVSSDAQSDASDMKEDIPSEVEDEPRKKPVQRKRKVVVGDTDDEEADAPNGSSHKNVPDLQDDGLEDSPEEELTKGRAAKAVEDDQVEKSESEMSSLIDESPVKRKRQKKSPKGKRQRGTKAAKPARTPKPKAAQDDGPDQAEIKKLQGWLVKCGIRKVWSKELAKYDTPKEKIKHLKGMLKDAGMEGKFSVEKAARIKEQREFAKDLEAIQEGERIWGKVEEAETGRPKRRAAAARKPLVDDPGSDEDDEDQEDDLNSDDADDHNEDEGESESDGAGDDSAEDSE